MMSKINTPITILVFLYLMIIGISFIVVGLSAVAAHDIKVGLENRSKVQASEYCKKYMDEKDYEKYESCIVSFIKQMQIRN